MLSTPLVGKGMNAKQTHFCGVSRALKRRSYASMSYGCKVHRVDGFTGERRVVGDVGTAK